MKLTGCKFEGNGIDFSLPAGLVIVCLHCGHKEKLNEPQSGSVSCPECGSKDIEITGESK